MRSFPSAPRWYRPLLHAEAVALRAGYRRLGRAREAKAVSLEDTRSGASTNMLGNIIAERAVPGDVPGWVMGQHVARYAWAMPACADRAVVELGSGTGYGSYILSWVARSTIGLDIDEDSVRRARAEYPGVEYRVADLSDPAALADGEVAVCFEVLEHLEDPAELLSQAIARYDRFLLSFPNPVFHGSHLNPYHQVDWPLRELRRQMRRAGASTWNELHQNRRDANVRPRALPWSSIWLMDVVAQPGLRT
jgi:SAM-dependent methyltransferase